jgi:hypothetical protein
MAVAGPDNSGAAEGESGGVGGGGGWGGESEAERGKARISNGAVGSRRCYSSLVFCSGYA